MNVLIVDSDAALGMFLKKGLEVEGHCVGLAADGDAGLELALLGSFELLVLELNLPKRDGIDLLRGLREQGVDTSAIVLTARNALADRVQSFDLGADHFMTKPFSFSELTARCRNLVRKRESFANSVLRHKTIELNRMDRKVTCVGRAVELTVKEFALLEYLMLARGRTCSRSELLREVWRMSPDSGTNVVDVYVNYLRKKLGAGQAAEWDSVIDTVRGEGYALGNGKPAIFAGAKKPAGSVTREHLRAMGSVESFGQMASEALAPGRELLHA